MKAQLVILAEKACVFSLKKTLMPGMPSRSDAMPYGINRKMEQSSGITRSKITSIAPGFHSHREIGSLFVVGFVSTFF
jgi:hypothetical protein